MAEPHGQTEHRGEPDKVEGASSPTYRRTDREETGPAQERGVPQQVVKERDSEAEKGCDGRLVQIEVLEIDRLRDDRECEANGERSAKGESGYATQIKERVDENEAEEFEDEVCEPRRVGAAELQQDAGEHIHPRWIGVRKVDGLREAIAQVLGVAQEHPFQNEIEPNTGSMQQPTAGEECGANDGVFAHRGGFERCAETHEPAGFHGRHDSRGRNVRRRGTRPRKSLAPGAAGDYWMPRRCTL